MLSCHFRILRLVLAALLSISLAACGGGSGSNGHEVVDPGVPAHKPAAINLRWASLPKGGLNAIAFGNGRYVAATHYGVLTSDDGVTWSLPDTRFSIPLQKVIFAAGMFVGARGDGAIHTSHDGSVWTERHSGLGALIFSLFHADGRFIAAIPGKALVTSADGVIWNQVESTDVPTKVEFVGGRYFGSNYLGKDATSADGATWTELPGLPGALQRVRYLGGRFISLNVPAMFDPELRGSLIHTSDDGIHWTQRVATPAGDVLSDLYEVQNGIAAIGKGYVLYSADGLTWERRESGVANATVQLGRHHGEFVAISGAGTLMTSTDGIAWADRGKIREDVALLREFIAGDGPLVVWGNAVSDASHGTYGPDVIMSSADRSAWSASAPLLAPRPEDLIFAQGMFVGASAGFGGVSQIWSSIDGSNWQLRPVEGPVSKLGYGDGKFIAIGQNTILTSNDAITWTRRVSSTARPLIDVAFGNGTFVVLESSRQYDANGTYNPEPNVIWTSTDGVEWVTRTTGEVRSLQSIAFGNGRFVAVGSGDVSSDGRPAEIATSEDGIVWRRAHAITSARAHPLDVAYGNGRFVAVGYGAPLFSIDGLSWESRAPETHDALFDVTYGDGQFVAAGIDSAGGVIATSADGTTWKKEPQATAGLEKAVFGNNVWVVLPNYYGAGILVSP